jgi:hypothetical protein
MNRYAYVPSNPLNLVDPLGLQCTFYLAPPARVLVDNVRVEVKMLVAPWQAFR